MPRPKKTQDAPTKKKTKKSLYEEEEENEVVNEDDFPKKTVKKTTTKTSKSKKVETTDDEDELSDLPLDEENMPPETMEHDEVFTNNKNYSFNGGKPIESMKIDEIINYLINYGETQFNPELRDGAKNLLYRLRGGGQRFNGGGGRPPFHKQQFSGSKRGGFTPFMRRDNNRDRGRNMRMGMGMGSGSKRDQFEPSNDLYGDGSP